MPVPSVEPRLQQRYLKMVESHAQASQALASGIHAVPDARSAFAATQAAHRFLNNRRVTLRALAKPLIEVARVEVATACDQGALVAHDWSQLMYPNHDAKRDRVAHFREWNRHSGRFFLVRADDRLVEWEGNERKCSTIRQILDERGKFRDVRPVEYRGKPAQQYVAEVAVRLLRAGQRNRPQAGDRQKLPGPPLPLRLVFAEVRNDAGQVLATWRLLTNPPAEVDDATVALWYYWRWSIEKYFKLLKSAGMNVEGWQQETAHAIAARLLVASMACVTVWRLARSRHPQAEPARQLLVRLSGRQMKRSQPWTMPAMLAGMWTLLAMIEVLNQYSPAELQELAHIALANPRGPQACRLV